MYRIQFITHNPHRLFWEETAATLPEEGIWIEKRDTDDHTHVSGTVTLVTQTVFDYFIGTQKVPQYIVVVKTQSCKIKGRKIYQRA